MMVQCIKEEFEVEWDGGRQRVQGSEDEEGGEEEEQDLDQLMLELEEINDDLDEAKSEEQAISPYKGLNTRAMGMIYWGLSQTLRQPRQQFHKYAEVFMEKQIDRMLSENKTESDPVDIFDQILQASAVMVHQQSFKNSLNINKQMVALLSKSVSARKSMAKVLDLDGNVLAKTDGPQKVQNAEIPFEMAKGDLVPIQLDQIVHIKLILTSLAKDRKNLRKLYKKNPDLKLQVDMIIEDSVDLLLSMKTNHFPKNPIK